MNLQITKKHVIKEIKNYSKTPVIRTPFNRNLGYPKGFEGYNSKKYKPKS